MSTIENNRIIIDLDICIQTEECAAVCPENVIEIQDGYPTITKDCKEPCLECARICSSSAITLKN